MATLPSVSSGWELTRAESGALENPIVCACSYPPKVPGSFNHIICIHFSTKTTLKQFPQTLWLKTTGIIRSQFWKLDVWNQCVSRAMLSMKAVGQNQWCPHHFNALQPDFLPPAPGFLLLLEPPLLPGRQAWQAREWWLPWGWLSGVVALLSPERNSFELHALHCFQKFPSLIKLQLSAVVGNLIKCPFVATLPFSHFPTSLHDPPFPPK